jgi:mannose/fructose/N-acetylgalactosamine-specific phosphotransferase system component IIC
MISRNLGLLFAAQVTFTSVTIVVIAFLFSIFISRKDWPKQYSKPYYALLWLQNTALIVGSISSLIFLFALNCSKILAQSTALKIKNVLYWVGLSLFIADILLVAIGIIMLTIRLRTEE